MTVPVPSEAGARRLCSENADIVDVLKIQSYAFFVEKANSAPGMFCRGRRPLGREAVKFKNFTNAGPAVVRARTHYIIRCDAAHRAAAASSVARFVHFGSRLRQSGRSVVSFVVPELQFVRGILRKKFNVFNFV
ncbi:MAG: hypothetical protein K2I43_06960 [Alistipes sp.]|nr:hypothetical protein [Alistipes sp.]